MGVVFGEPLDFTRFAGMEGDRFVLRSITDEIMYELLTDQRSGVRGRLRLVGQGEAARQAGAEQPPQHGQGSARG